MIASRLSVSLAFALGCATHVTAQQCKEEALPLFSPISSAQLGSALDIAGDFMVAAPGSDALPGRAGVYVNAGAGWNAAGFIPEDGLGLETVGDVAISGGVLISGIVPLAAVGFPAVPNGSLPESSGIVDVYDLIPSNTVIATLIPPSTLGYPIEAFGTSVEMSSDSEWIFVGAPATFDDAGCVFSYERTGPTTWTFRDDVFAGSTPDRFGSSIAVEGTRLIVGAPGTDTTSGADAGAVYFYDLDPSTGVMTLVGSDLGVSAGAALGSSVAIDTGSSGFVAAAGAPKNADFGVDGGSVTFYSGTTKVGTLSQSGGQQLGTSVAVTGDTVFAGRPGDDAVDRYGVSTTGVTYVETFTGAGTLSGDRFGGALAAEGIDLVVGAPKADFAGGLLLETGRIVSYTLTGFTTTDLGDGLAGVGGLTPQLTATSGFCEGDDFTITLSDAAPFAQAGLFIGFQASVNAPFKGGTLVPSPDLLVLLPTGLGFLPITSAWPLGVNIPLEFQYWIQDAAGPKGFSASNAIRVAP